MYGLGIDQPLRYSTYVTQILQIYWIYKDAIDLSSRWKVRFRHTFFKIKYKECFIRWCWSHVHTLLIILALQTSSLFKN